MLIVNKTRYNINKPITSVRIVVRTLLVLSLALLIFGMVQGLFSIIKDGQDNLDRDDYIRMSNRQYTSRNLSGLKGIIDDYKSDDPDFALYYEACDIYDEYMSYCMWTDEDTANEFPEEAKINADEHLLKLTQYTSQAKDKRNIALAKELLQKAVDE